MILLKYLESTGTQYIDTGVKFDTTGCKVELDMECTTTSENWFCGTGMDFEGGIVNGVLYKNAGSGQFIGGN